jgi:NTE family protein
MLPNPPRRGVAGLLYVLSLMLRHQSIGILPMLGPDRLVIYLPAPCPLPVAPHDFSRGEELVRLGFDTVKPFLDGLRVSGPGIYGHPHFHSFTTPATARVEVGC